MPHNFISMILNDCWSFKHRMTGISYFLSLLRCQHFINYIPDLTNLFFARQQAHAWVDRRWGLWPWIRLTFGSGACGLDVKWVGVMGTQGGSDAVPEILNMITFISSTKYTCYTPNIYQVYTWYMTFQRGERFHVNMYQHNMLYIRYISGIWFLFWYINGIYL